MVIVGGKQQLASAVVTSLTHGINHTLGKTGNFRINSHRFVNLSNLPSALRKTDVTSSKNWTWNRKDTATLVVHGFTDKRSALSFILIFK